LRLCELQLLMSSGARSMDAMTRAPLSPQDPAAVKPVIGRAVNFLNDDFANATNCPWRSSQVGQDKRLIFQWRTLHSTTNTTNFTFHTKCGLLYKCTKSCISRPQGVAVSHHLGPYRQNVEETVALGRVSRPCGALKGNTWER